MMNPNKINLLFINDDVKANYFAILFEPGIIDVSVVTNSQDLTQFLRQYKRIARVNFPLTLDEYH